MIIIITITNTITSSSPPSLVRTCLSTPPPPPGQSWRLNFTNNHRGIAAHQQSTLPKYFPLFLSFASHFVPPHVKSTTVSFASSVIDIQSVSIFLPTLALSCVLYRIHITTSTIRITPFDPSN